jgi:2-polyprenyl-6-methoxyphenol hydroxylase-like FAD-dependent oxidoreductase
MNRDFSYCYSLIGRNFQRINQFKDVLPCGFIWNQSPTNVVHLPQNKFEQILRAQVDCSLYNETYYGCEVVNVKSQVTDNNKISVNLKNLMNNNDNNITPSMITCDYLIGSDGSNSFVRKFLNIPWNGEECLQNLINVHFRCEGLFKYLNPRPAMLYFVFNEVSVYIYSSSIYFTSNFFSVHQIFTTCQHLLVYIL